MGEVVKQLEEMVGHDYPESGSSNVDVPPKWAPDRHLYGSDSEYMHTSRDSSEPSFPISNTGPLPWIQMIIFINESGIRCRRALWHVICLSIQI
ncbi:hypothetical protein KP509_1Z288000 [Ceratopteris richardii]|nr:hypothetical protein KP509_1Z288000 [Ceratopteris richardii]